MTLQLHDVQLQGHDEVTPDGGKVEKDTGTGGGTVIRESEGPKPLGGGKGEPVR